ncbi:ABC transporter ATP-binding protein [Thalassobaculum sp. OXR-137]|uniref:ABC transporter ATP-binding protein n=1 Tax=Thalassobaculum sp. OXR-137 TaxID=3100173 RepID=UPI002AC89E44|nr:ABC transporter ATP-binding protein [Thalassobaculum sp. OXR-137]WPZ32395.1 ABC transporter ATP-binding protein [Thalassobaculum sp. OXR-137]
MPDLSDTSGADVALLISHLDVRFGKGEGAVHAVRDVSLTVRRGESFGLVGESGSGKSTVLRAIAGLATDWTGRIAVDGTDLGPKRSKTFYETVQMVFQDPYGSLHPRHTVDRTLSEPAKIHGIGNVGARVEALLRDVGLGREFRFRYPHQLSGGQRQRVAIARALMLEPRILLLDEPTSALDVSVQAEILNLLQRLKQEHGLTYILVSHDLAVIAHMCDRLAVMNAGRVVEEMDVDQLRRAQPQHNYTRQLLNASLGYDRETADSLLTFD